MNKLKDILKRLPNYSGKPNSCTCDRLGKIGGKPIPHSHIETDEVSSNIRPDIATDGYIKPRKPAIMFPQMPPRIVAEYPFPKDPIKLREPNLWYPAPKADFEGVNICVWYDRTLRPMRGHKANCKWTFDGQIWKHL